MSEDSEEKPGVPEAPATKVARKRPAVRKAAKRTEAKEEEPGDDRSPEVPSEPPAPQVESIPYPSSSRSPSSSSEGQGDSSDGGRIAFLVETPAAEPSGNSKKRRRRKKKHGQPQQQGPHPHAVSAPMDGPHVQAAPLAEQGAQGPAPVMHAAPRPKLDSDEVAKKAWKIFQAEVGEEGLALIDDHDAREISRRCFRLAEIFLEEAARRTTR